MMEALAHRLGTTPAQVTPAAQTHHCVREGRFCRLVPICLALRPHPHRASLPSRARLLALRMPLQHGITTRALAFST